jgi:hypothetical protein
MQTDYNLDKHIHDYSVWTAARAVQRNFTTTANIKHAIEQSDLPSFARYNDIRSVEEYDRLHCQWAEQLINAFDNSRAPKCSYGRAAKIISIYLKTSVLLCNRASCTASSIMHPPIDGILLRNIAEIPGLSDLKNIRWTKLDKDEYWSLIKRLRSHFGQVNWKLEKYWTPELE